MPSIPQVEYRADGSVAFTFPYSAGLVHQIKAAIPTWARAYDPATKTWTVAQPYAALAGGLLCQTFGHVAVSGEPSRHGSFTVIHGGACDPDLMVLHLRDDAPPELVEAAYRCLARLHHPDRGGDTTRMQRLNAAIGRLRDRRGVAS